MIKMFIAGEEVVSKNQFTINEEILSASSTILNNCYPADWELTKDYVSKFYYPKDYSKFILASGDFIYGNDEFGVLEKTGKNLINKKETHNGVNSSGALTTYTTYLGIDGYVEVEPNTTYTVSFEHDVLTATMMLGEKDANGNFIGRRTIGKSIRTFTTSENAKYVLFYVYKSTDFGTIGGWVQLEKGTVATSYESYNCTNLEYETNIEKAFNSIDVYGNTTQEVAERNKNLLYITSVSNQLGLTITRVSNSEISISGTANAGGTLTIPLYATQLKNTPYTFSLITTGTISQDISWIDLNTSNNLSILDVNANNTYTGLSTSETTSSNITEMALDISNGTVFTNFHIQMQLEANSSATSYVVAELNKPTPQNPSDIVNLGYQNLCDGNFVQGNVNGNEILTQITDYINYYIKAGTKYTFSTNLDTTIYKYQIYVNNNPFPKSNTDFEEYTSGWQTSSSFTFNTNADGYIAIGIVRIDGKEIRPYHIEGYWFELDDSPYPRSYISPGKYGIEIKNTGKNLWKPFNYTTNSNGITLTFNENGEIQISGTSTGNVISYSVATAVSNNFYSTLEAGTYSASIYGNTYAQLQVYDTLGNLLLINTNSSGTFTINETKSVILRIYISADRIVNETISLQLEKGNRATQYEEYKSNSRIFLLDNPLRAIGDVRDKLYIENGTLKVERNIGKIILNGTENWSRNTSWDYTNTNCYILNSSVLSTTQRYMTNYFNYDSTAYGKDVNGITGIVWGGSLLFRVYKTIASNLDNFKTWLSTHNTEIQYILAEPYIEEIGNVLLPSSYEGINNVNLISNLDTRFTVYYYVKNYDILFAGIVKNSGDISLNPREPHYCSLQILDYKTFLSESNTLDYVIADKTIREAIELVISSVSDYGFVVGNINISAEDDKIKAYSTLNKTAYDVLQYLAEISGSKWRARYLDSSTMAIDFYDPDLLPQASDIEYNKEYWEENNIVDMTFNYGTRDYRNKQIILSDEVYAGIDYEEVILSNGYNTSFITQENVGLVKEITVNGVKKDFISMQEKEEGAEADFYYTPGKNIIESVSSYTAGTQIGIKYTPLVKGRQIVYNNDEIGRISTQTNTSGVIARYESRNDIVSSLELERIGKTYIDYKGKAEVIITLTTQNKDLYNIGEVVYFNAPIEELQQKYMVKTKKTEYVVIKDVINLFYIYELTSSFNSEKAINYFDNQRNKAQGNIQEGESITRNIDIANTALVVFGNATITEISPTIVGDNVLNNTLDSPLID